MRKQKDQADQAARSVKSVARTARRTALGATCCTISTTPHRRRERGGDYTRTCHLDTRVGRQGKGQGQRKQQQHPAQNESFISIS